ncbi:MAG: FtsX-like permease family protein [Gemmataceae bacterium]|nr:ABC transporter permease [Gemmata sp.]MDW8198994.1 FtsX-like permease family protein [Gemmataceae bacterium]
MNRLALVRLALDGLWRQKMRTTLTLVGVTIGTCALAFSCALGLGLRAFIDTEFQGRDDFWRIVVRVDDPLPDESRIPATEQEKIQVLGQMSEQRKARLREALIERYTAQRLVRPPQMLTPERCAAIAALPDVAEIRTYRSGDGRIWADTADTSVPAFTISGPLDELTPRLIVGRLPQAKATDELVVSELVAYQLGFRDDADLDKILGLSVKLDVGGVKNTQQFALARALLGHKPPEELTRGQWQVLEKLTSLLRDKLDLIELSAAEKLELQKLFEQPADPDRERAADSGKIASGVYRICGVVRLLTRAERKKRTPLDPWELATAHAFLPPPSGETLFRQLPWAADGGFLSADVRLRPGGDLPATVQAIEDMGFRTYSAAKWFTAAKREVTLIAAGLNLFAFIALFVAAVGITNTLVTSVLERTKEIGILRAVGATRQQILALFLLEGAIIGLMGAVVGLALARGLAVWADDWVRGLLDQQMGEREMLTTTIFIFPQWLWLGSMIFAVGLTTLAALYPARRAAHIHPIEALRYN